MAARFSHHDDPSVDFIMEVTELEAIAFDRRRGLRASSTLKDRIFAASTFQIKGSIGEQCAKAALRDLEAEFCRHDILARRRAVAAQQSIERELESALWMG